MRVVGRGERVDDAVGLDGGDVGIAFERAERGRQLGSRDLDDLGARYRQGLDEIGAGVGADVGPLGGVRARPRAG